MPISSDFPLPGMSIKEIYQTGILVSVLGERGAVVGIAVLVSIPVPAIFGTGISTGTKFGISTDDRYCRKSTDNR
jgi:hypothetical protein